MMADAPVFLRKLLQCGDQASDQKSYIYIQTKWGADRVLCAMQDSRTGQYYKGELSHNELNDIASELEIPQKEFHDECRAALTTNIGLPGFQYRLDAKERLFKVIKESEFHMEYMEVKLREVGNGNELLETAIDLIAEHDKESKDYMELLATYQHSLDERTRWKRKMLKKCALLLNTKKAKISQLQNQTERQSMDSEDDDFNGGKAADDDDKATDDDDKAADEDDKAADDDDKSVDDDDKAADAKASTSRGSCTTQAAPQLDNTAASDSDDADYFVSTEIIDI